MANGENGFAMNDGAKRRLSFLSILPVVLMGISPKDGHAIGPCDIYQAAGTPCVAAHSTVRAQYAAYAGNLYQVRRGSDNATKDIGVASGSFSDAASQDAFCTGTTCTISIIYDQTGNGNDLKAGPPGSATTTQTGPDREADANGLKISVGGHTAYAVNIPAGVGYRVDKTTGVATGDNPEVIYMVTSGIFQNGACCFDYGNAETDNNDDGAGTMEAIYFGTCWWWGKGNGNGPWVMGDLENGLWAGDVSPYNGNTPVSYPYVTAMVKGDRSNHWAIKAGNSQTGNLTTMFDGARPNGYDPMKKQGAIILGIGGDNSNGAQGNFYEGVMTGSYTTDAADSAVQANIVAAGYGSSTPIVTIPSPRDSIFNGGFGLGALGWTFNVWGGGATGSVVNGEYEIQIDSVGTHNSDIQVVQNGLVLVQGNSYQVKFDAYSTTDRTLEANVEQDVSPWTSYLPALQELNLTTTKTTFSYTFTMTNPTDSNGRVSFNAGASTGTVFLDNISIKAVTDGIRSAQAVAGFPAVMRLDHSLLKVEFGASQGTALTVDIFDLNGKPVRSGAFRAGVGQVQSWTSDLSGMPQGVYVVGIRAGGQMIHRSKFMYGN
jgi:hypothetical protein